MAIERPSLYRPAAPSYPGGGAGGGLGEGLRELGRAVRRRGEKNERERQRRGNLLYFQAADAYAGAWNDALISGEVGRLDARGLGTWVNRQIEEQSKTLRAEFPELAEKWEANQRSQATTAIAAKLDEQHKRSESELLGALREGEDRIRRQIPDQLRLAMDARTPNGVRAAAFDSIQALADEHRLLTSDLEPEERARVRAAFSDDLNAETFRAAAMHAAHTGAVQELGSRIRNRTDWRDVSAKGGPRLTEGMATNAIQDIMDEAWAEQARWASARRSRREAEAARARDERADRYEHVRDEVLAGRMSYQEGESMLSGWGYEGGEQGTSALAAAVKADIETDDAVSELLAARSEETQAAYGGLMLDLMSMGEGEAKGSLRHARRMRDAGLLTKGQFDDYDAAVKEQVQYDQWLQEEADEGERTRTEQIRRYRKSTFTDHGYVEFYQGGFVNDHQKLKGVAMIQRMDARAVSWIHANEATEQQIGLVYENLMPAVYEFWRSMNVPADLWTGADPEAETGDADEIEDTSGASDGSAPGLLDSFLGWFRSDEPEKADAPSAARQGGSSGMNANSDDASARLERELPIGDLSQALDALAREGQRVDTHREFFSLMPVGQLGAYLKYAPDGSLSAFDTMSALDTAPGISPAQAARIWMKVVTPLTNAAEQVRGWRSGVAKAKDASDWLKSKGMTP